MRWSEIGRDPTLSSLCPLSNHATLSPQLKTNKRTKPLTIKFNKQSVEFYENLTKAETYRMNWI